MSRPIRVVLYVVLILIAVAWLADRTAPPLVPTKDTPLAVSASQMEETLASIRADVAKHGRVVVVLGDSALRWHPPLKAHETLAAMLEAGSARAGVPIRVVAHDGFDAVAYYLLVDAIAALRPAAVVLTTNFQSFTDKWFKRVDMKHPALAAFVRPGRVVEAIELPLEQAGIADASLLVRPAFRAIGMSDLPANIDGYRTRIRERLEGVDGRAVKTALLGRAVAHAMPPAAEPRPMPPAAAPRPPAAPLKPMPANPTGAGAVIGRGAFRYMDLYPANLAPEQATVRVFAATVRDLTARGVPTVALLAPLHVQAARMTGAWTTRDFPRAVRVLRETAEAGGGRTLDLTEVLPLETYFVDRFTHFTAEGNRMVADRVLDELRPLVND